MTQEDAQAALGNVDQGRQRPGAIAVTLNIRYDKATDAGLERWSSRKHRVYALIRQINPDIIGLQEVEEHTWDDIRDEFSDYHRWYRSRGGPTNADEGVGILLRGSRFHYPGSTSDEKTYTYLEQSARCGTNSGINRNIMRIKAVDSVTNRTWDIFNTHFPTSASWPTDKDCFKKGMAKMVANWVEDYGDNILLMGDFNTGWSKSGNMHEPMAFLYDQSSVDLDDAIRTKYGRSFRSTDSIITSEADKPWKRFGSMIDHIMVGPAFVVEDAKIDRTLFLGDVPVDCDGSRMRTDSSGNRDSCSVSNTYTWVPVENMDSYSDHWGVWADIRRIDCPDGC